jgi:hypothetical protein
MDSQSQAWVGGSCPKTPPAFLYLNYIRAQKHLPWGAKIGQIRDMLNHTAVVYPHLIFTLHN